MALQEIHEQGIVHADLTPSNCLLAGSDMEIKVSDFGISQILHTGYDFAHRHAATLPYASPEVICGEKYGKKTDIWALGCILYELIVGKPAFNFDNDDYLKKRVLKPAIP